ncbi:hypothetical protein BJ165DRAFT_1599222 [Panaeolus papilionaceus]|nr:hypothetical protein BJ165DRAFT_1599222 [Panaeolus papilionaceus]
MPEELSSRCYTFIPYFCDIRRYTMAYRGVCFQVTEFRLTEASALSVIDSYWYAWNHDEDAFRNVDPNYPLLSHNNLVRRIIEVDEQLKMLEEDKATATTPGKEDRLLLKAVKRQEPVLLARLQSFLDDLYDHDPEFYHSQYPHLPFPREIQSGVIPQHSLLESLIYVQIKRIQAILKTMFDKDQ